MYIYHYVQPRDSCLACALFSLLCLLVGATKTAIIMMMIMIIIIKTIRKIIIIVAIINLFN